MAHHRLQASAGQPESEAIPTISTRICFRLLPNLFEEDTTSMILVSHNKLYVDLRFSTKETEHPLTYGSSGIVNRTDRSVVWEPHAHTLHKKPLPQFQSIQTYSNGDTAVRGTRETIDEGHEHYEEIWRHERHLQPRICVVLVLKKFSKKGRLEPVTNSIRGIVIRIGRWCQGLVRCYRRITAERWYREPNGQWKRILFHGSEDQNSMLPCAVACLDRDFSTNGSVEKYQGARYYREVGETEYACEKVVARQDRVLMGRFEWAVTERYCW